MASILEVLGILGALHFALRWSGFLVGSRSHTSTSNVRRSGSTNIPSYENRAFIREYPSVFNRTLTPEVVRDPKGFFSFRVGITQQRAILAAAASTTTVDGSPQKSPKLDNTGFVHFGRSYNVGASPGLTDDIILNNQYAKNYSYEEMGVQHQSQMRLQRHLTILPPARRRQR
jgi:hypothetical protein